MPDKTRRQKELIKPRSRVDQALRKLETCLATDAGPIREQLRAFAKGFRDYSPLNRILIGLQRPDATFLKGRKQWEKEGRTVRRGAKAIFIIAPALKPGDKRPTRFFALTRVYDVSDTEGPPFSMPTSLDTRGPEEVIAKTLSALEEWTRRSGVELVYGSPMANYIVAGCTNGRTIWVQPSLGPAEQLATLAHEIAHVKLHFQKKERGKVRIVDLVDQALRRNQAELEAELTSFFLLSLAGVDTAQASGFYLSTWKASLTQIRAATKRCLATAAAIWRDGEKKRYRPIVEQGRPSLRAAMRLAVG